MSEKISWSIPYLILRDPQYTKINIYRGINESDESSYSKVAVINRWVNNDKTREVSSFIDVNVNDKSNFYFIKYLTDFNEESRMLLTTYSLTPKELRWVNELRKMLDPIVMACIKLDGTLSPMSDEDMMSGINLAINYVNAYPPLTEFKTNSLPLSIESIMLLYARYFTIMSKSLGLSLRDFSYSDNGLSLQQSMSSSLESAMNQTKSLLDPLLAKAKMEFSLDGDGVGSLNFAIGVNGRLGMAPVDSIAMFRSLTQT